MINKFNFYGISSGIKKWNQAISYRITKKLSSKSFQALISVLKSSISQSISLLHLILGVNINQTKAMEFFF